MYMGTIFRALFQVVRFQGFIDNYLEIRNRGSRRMSMRHGCESLFVLGRTMAGTWAISSREEGGTLVSSCLCELYCQYRIALYRDRHIISLRETYPGMLCIGSRDDVGLQGTSACCVDVPDSSDSSPVLIWASAVSPASHQQACPYTDKLSSLHCTKSGVSAGKRLKCRKFKTQVRTRPPPDTAPLCYRQVSTAFSNNVKYVTSGTVFSLQT